jgi:hypothetical protein
MTDKDLKEIAEQLSCGLRAFVHKESEKMLFVPNTEDFFDIDEDAWEEELEELETNAISYYEIEKWRSWEAYNMMDDFAKQLTDDKRLQNRLFDALNKRKPFREFKFVIENSDDYRDQWFEFKNKWEFEYVKIQWNRINQAEDLTEE